MFTTNELNELAVKYKKCIEQVEFNTEKINLKTDFLDLLDLDDLADRNNKWNIIKSKYKPIELKKLANPYFIGYGNPNPKTDPKVLFLGKELGFEVNSRPDLLLHESINSILQWKNISEKKGLLNFDPRFPQKSILKTDKRHTWAYCTKLLISLLNISDLSYPKSFLTHNDKDYNESFLSKCFLTEISYTPSKEGKSLSIIRKAQFFEKRIAFLKKYILPKFQIIIIGASNYFDDIQSNRKEQLETLFGYIQECKSSHYEDRKILPFTHYITGENKNIYVTKQLSGGAGWSNEGLSGFGNRIKAFL